MSGSRWNESASAVSSQLSNRQSANTIPSPWGKAWTRSRRAVCGPIAEDFAKGIFQTFEGGGVLLRAAASPEAIIYAVPEEDDRYGEQEWSSIRAG
jgi:hypothetical protein